MNLAELAQAGRTPELPLNLTLESEALELQSLLRTLPSKRYVGKALWQDKTVLAKIFVGKKANRRYQRELSGAMLLATPQTINTPTLIHHQADAEGGWLLFDFLEEAQTLHQRWQQVVNQPLLSTEQQTILEQALQAIALLHQQGLWQEDLHLENLMQQQEQLFWIDGDGMCSETIGAPLSKANTQTNLAVFFAQLPPTIDRFVPKLLAYYQVANPFVKLTIKELVSEIQQIREHRVSKFLKKIGRNCTLFSVRNTANELYAVVRREKPELEPLLANPDQYINQGRIIKDLGTATVADTTVNGKRVLVKRYNIKSFAHRLKRFWRPSRGWHSWREGFRLRILGIATPKPLAVLEERFCWTRGRAWLVTEYLDGQDLLTHFKPYEDSTPPEAELNALDVLFAALIQNQISHGDLKGTNLFWVSNQWTLIDLDAVKQHKNINSFKKAYARDRARFLRNWPENSALYTLFDKRLPTVDSIE